MLIIARLGTEPFRFAMAHLKVGTRNIVCYFLDIEYRRLVSDSLTPLALVPWTIGSLHTKSWPPTMPGALKKVLGGWFLQQI